MPKEVVDMVTDILLLLYINACRFGAKVANLTTDQEIRVRFPAYPDYKEFEDIFGRPGAHVGVGSAR